MKFCVPLSHVALLRLIGWAVLRRKRFNSVLIKWGEIIKYPEHGDINPRGFKHLILYK